MRFVTRVCGLLMMLVFALAVVFTYWKELPLVRKTLQLSYEHQLLSPEREALSKNVTVYRNGYSTGGVEIQLSAKVLASRSKKGELAAYLSQFVEVEGLDETMNDSEEEMERVVFTVVADRVYNGQGALVHGYTDLQFGDRLYLVAPNLHFMWPFVKLGHRVLVTSTFSPINEPVIIESMSESPRTFRLHNFFTHEEADTLIKQTLLIDDPYDRLQPSSVGATMDRQITSKHRTSENAFDTMSTTAMSIRKRVFDVLSLGTYQDDMCDGLQLLRYHQKQAYIPHYDYFPINLTENFNFNPHRGGSNRFATVVLYLSNVPLGGQTVFPLAEMPSDLPMKYRHPFEFTRTNEAIGTELFESNSWELNMVRECSTKLASYPLKGSAVLFYSQKPNGEVDPMSLHGGCPVLEGTKWGANLWVWNKRRFNAYFDSSIVVVFTNPTPYEVKLFWSASLMGTLAANGGKRQFTSYPGHKWVLKIKEYVVLEYVVTKNTGEMQKVTVPLMDEHARKTFSSSSSPIDCKSLRLVGVF
ncbi:hypothetical protein CCR75_002910 [Bremia lactucae]|uniref:Fe2OG dioxygenase domain-containing protein n=1 Tax=Bremia lactucae TaxID=4779 RepID=A0A976FPT2_BRELC|nr:hypothetical protein CCR75_002910 [Bremia lactucae]